MTDKEQTLSDKIRIIHQRDPRDGELHSPGVIHDEDVKEFIKKAEEESVNIDGIEYISIVDLLELAGPKLVDAPPGVPSEEGKK